MPHLAGTNYLDMTGEIDVFGDLRARFAAGLDGVELGEPRATSG